MRRNDDEISKLNTNQKMCGHGGEISEENLLNDWNKINKDIEEKIIATQNELNEAKSATADLVNRRNKARQQRTQIENNRKAELDRLNRDLDTAQKKLATLQKAQNTHTPKIVAQQKKST